MAPGSGPAKGWELVIPNPKLKLMGQVREVLRVNGTLSLDAGGEA